MQCQLAIINSFNFVSRAYFKAEILNCAHNLTIYILDMVGEVNSRKLMFTLGIIVPELIQINLFSIFNS